MASIKSAVATYHRRLIQEWPRLVVALVSLYGIYYATNVIQTTSEQIQALGSFVDHPYPVSPSANSADLIPLNVEPSQLSFKPSDKIDNTSGNNKKSHKHHNSDNNYSNRHHLGETSSPPLFGQIRLVSSPDNEIDFDGHHEAAAIYTLLVISSLSIIDNAIGLMVATRRSLRLTQIAFAIWCLRFLFRILSLVSVLFMLVVGADFRKSHHIPLLDVDVGVDFSNNGNNESNGNNNEHLESTTMMLTVLEVIVAAVHGWSLLVLIRDLRNQPRPRTVLARAWIWFCGTKWGRRFGLNARESSISSGIASITRSGSIVSFGDVENGGNGSNVWDREIAASLGLSSGLLSSASSIRSVAATIPEMIVVGTSGRSRASSISSFSSAEKV
ncbi:hypothetical protein BGX26_007429 [Mortierella sp. AD094]|nr:hypothetical protein BGX26_007429 [Mortierella sp. AD094]